jgi:ABC-2 type transport system ATP-binding protein
LHTTPIIELQDLRVRLGQQEILQGISCRLGVSGTGKAVGLLGPNGAGKSTLILTLLGFYQISAGNARVLGHDCRSHSREIKARIGYMPENEAFIADMTAVHFLRIMGELSGLPQRVALEKAHEVLFHVGLGEARYRTLGTYSLGMKQMAKLAQSILHGPEVLILDEPTNGLDPTARIRMLKLIREMKEEHNMNVVLCSHLLRDVEEVCDEVMILNEGRLVHQANLEEERHTNRRFVELEVTGDDSELADALQEQGAEGVSEGSGRWRIVFPPGMELDVLWQLVARQNLAIHHLTHRRDSLEEIFLKAVGHLEPSEQSTTKLRGKEITHGRL